MRILMIGGSSFVGRHITEAAVAAGHDVTTFNRGQTNPDAIEGIDRLYGDRNTDEGLAALEGKDWDATIDVCAYRPSQVERLLGKINRSTGRYVFISTVSVYPEDTDAGFDEDSPLLEPQYGEEVTNETYGPLKVACELKAVEALGEDRVTTVRPGYVVGPHDPTHRFTYWVERVAAGGRILGPDAEQPLQAIDGRDLGAFVVGLTGRGEAGAFIATAPDPALRFDEVLRAIAEGTGTEELDVEWRGPDDRLPLTDGPGSWGLMSASLNKGVAHGLAWRPLSETARDTLTWVTGKRTEGSYKVPESILTVEQERQALS